MLGCLLAFVLAPSVNWGPEMSAPSPKGALALSDGRILMPGRADGSDCRLVCFVSGDEGKTWTQNGVIASDPNRRTDLGDGNIVQDRKGNLYAVYRHNHHGPGVEKPDYAVEVAMSTDGGKSWKAHSTVAISRPTEGPSRGLWAPYLFVTDGGDIQCYYDDEDTPYRMGFSGHQWVMMKTLSTHGKLWEQPVTVARAHDTKVLSRDGMPSVIQLGKNQLACAFESVRDKPPHAGLVRIVFSADGGRTWSWTQRERDVLYEPKDRRYHAFAPSLIQLPGGQVLAFLATNEDRAEPGVSGTPARDLALDIKYVTSLDEGRTWERSAKPLYTGTHRNYLPWVVRLPGKQPRLFASFLDFDRGCLAKVGKI